MTEAPPLNILYLVHDLTDPAVTKRVLMLRDGGASVIIAGFNRTAELVQSIAGCAAVELGQTYNGRFAQRMWRVLCSLLSIKQHRHLFSGADIIIARNLEMLALGARGKGLSRCPSVLVYESLDIHRLLLRQDIIGNTLRWLEGRLAKKASALITSSPAFVSSYFQSISSVRLPIRLLENKVYNPNQTFGHADIKRKSGPPWRIGWFGAIRCAKSLDMLSRLAQEGNGKIEVIIRGHPSLDQFDDFYLRINAAPGLRFMGPYKNPGDLASIYCDVHFTWAIDMFEEGLNSAWLLPNRLYEGGMHGTVPIAFASVETGSFINRLDIGVTINSQEDLASFFHNLTPEKYRELEAAVLKIPEGTWRYDTGDCKKLIAYLDSLRHL